MSRAAARAGRGVIACLCAEAGLLVLLAVYIAWRDGFALGDVPSVLAQPWLWFYIALAAVVASALGVALRESRSRKAAAARRAPRSRTGVAPRPRAVRPAPEVPLEAKRVVVEFVPAGPTVVAEPANPPAAIPVAEPAPAPEPEAVPEPVAAPEVVVDLVSEPVSEPALAEEVVVDLGPEPAAPPEAPREPSPAKPEVALEHLKGWLEETSPEAVAAQKARALRKEDAASP